MNREIDKLINGLNEKQAQRILEEMLMLVLLPEEEAAYRHETQMTYEIFLRIADKCAGSKAYVCLAEFLKEYPEYSKRLSDEYIEF